MNKVSSSHRTTLKCKYLGNSGRISVARYGEKDPNRIMVAWRHELDISENYNRAVQEYLNKLEWKGHWVTSTVCDGAVAVCIEAVTP